MRRPPADARSGVGGGVLPLVLIFVLALELMAHGALLMARQEAAASRAGASLLQARVASESGLRTVELPVGASYLGTSIWGVVDGPAGSVAGVARLRVTARRLSRETWWWLSEGRVQGRAWGVRTGMPVWLPDPVERLRSFGAVAVVGAGAPAVGSENIDASSVRRDAAPLDLDPCLTWRPVLDSLFAGRATPTLRSESMDGAHEPTLGALDGERLLAWIGAGDGRPGGPRGVAGDLVLDHEEGSGLLIVGGSLELVGGRYEGVVLAGGRLTLRDGAVLVGFVRAAGGIDIAPDAKVVGSGCRALLALSRDLGRWVRPLPLPPGPFAPF